MNHGKEFWAMKCKICDHVHIGDEVKREPGRNLNVPFDGPHECPAHLGQIAHYQTKDWFPAFESQLEELDKTSDS